MESFTHGSDESSSCTQSDGDSTNSSNGTNPFLLCPRANSSLHLQLGGHARTHDIAEDTRPFKLARMEPPRHHQFHAAIANPQGASSLQYPRNVVGAIRGSDGLHNSTFLSQTRSYNSSALDDCRGLSAQAPPAARSHHGSLPYLGPTHQTYFTQDQWAELRQQTYVLKHVAAGNTPPSALLLPMGCKVENVGPINLGSNPGSFYLGLADSQPGRCRRTDGKKWRCGRLVVPDQKYCERHMHRGRGRSKAARLAKLNATVEAPQPLSSTRPLNQPLIQLLNQLAVPIQPHNQPPDQVQQPPIPAQPLKWLGNSAQPFVHPHTPYLAQPLHAESLSELPNPSKPLDWSLNQVPMQAEPLNRVHSYGEPPILAQAIPMSTVSEIKNRSNPPNGSVIKEASRAHTEDHDDVFTLDVQGIKRLLENAPCSMRSRNLVGQPKQSPNVADLLNVAHFRSSASQPKQPPSLMDILKMVDPAATPTPTTSVINHQLQHATKNNGIVAANCHQIASDSPARGCTGAPLSLALSGEPAAEKQSRKYSSSTAIISGSLNFLVGRQKEDMTSLELFKVKCEREEEGVDQNMSEGVDLSKHIEGSMARPNTAKIRGPSTILAEGCENHITNVSSSMTSNSASGGQSELPVLVKESRDCFGSSAMFEKASEKGNRNSAELIQNALKSTEGHLATTDGNSPNLVQTSLNSHKHSPRLDINSSNLAEVGSDRHINVIEPARSSPGLREEGSKHHEHYSMSERSSHTLSEGCLVHYETPIKPEKSIPGLLEKSLEQHVGSASLDTSHPISVKKSSGHHENSVKLDMNSSILVDESLGNNGSSGELEKNSASLSSPMEVLQTKATFDRSSSDSCGIANSSSKSTLNLDPAVLNMPETPTKARPC
eukprot:c21627_g1_i1 orf=192-2849(+)